jgi:hypothetical protein
MEYRGLRFRASRWEQDWERSKLTTLRPDDTARTQKKTVNFAQAMPHPVCEVASSTSSQL